jgi:UDP-N-acetylmuramoyl-L-alanyl-D-glutamate--2,6-diaminopimelate ligase
MTAPMVQEMDIQQLLPGVAPPAADLDVPGIAVHSDDVVPGGLFIACAGKSGHGLRFLDAALARGAGAVAWDPAGIDPAPRLPAGVCGLPVPGLGERLGEIANRFFENPSAGMAVVGITGTNGKTTVAWLLAQALGHLGRRAGYMGTLGYGVAGDVRASALTTADCVTTHRRLRELCDAGASDVAIEVSSHALDQGRVDGVSFRVVAFTNLTRDHLDYHRDMAAYGRSKERLFLGCGAGAAVINTGDEFGRALAGKLPGRTRLISVSVNGECSAAPALLQARRVAVDRAGMTVALDLDARSVELRTVLSGGFNVENLAVAAGVLLAEGFDLDAVGAALSACTAPPGRMETVSAGDGPRVIVDFAHTPDALCRVLAALRPVAPARLWCVFGCGGDRDPGKREAMGRAARTLADRVVITDDNPRHEDPLAIIAAIQRGTGRGPEVTVIRDRAEAIGHAVRNAAAGDVVVVAGKGHEAVQIVGDEQRAFSDQAVARAALRARP